MTWRCPVCRGGVPLRLVAGGRTWRCELDGHAFDVAREGYVNLLVTHQRRARPPGDSVEMLRARRRFLDTGAYEPLRSAIADALAPTGKGPGHVLDAGCGEGYYTRALGAHVWGVDIAKEAARLAARRATAGASYAVGNVYDLPLLDGSVDALVSVFAPLHTDEFDRVLRSDGGVAVVVTPGPDHLAGLAAHLFDDVVPHRPDPPFARQGATTTTVRFDLDLRGAAIADLLAMTPYSWFADRDRTRAVAALASLATPAEFLLTTYHRGDPV